MATLVRLYGEADSPYGLGMSPALRRLFRLCRTAFSASTAVLLWAGVALAGSWSAVEVRGTVLSLVGDKWEDVASGEVFPGNVVIRTLGTGRITLAGGGVGVGLGGNAAVQIVEQGRSYALRQYAGALAVVADALHTVTVEVANGRMSFSGGQIQISITGDVTRIEVRSGNARFVDARGGDTALVAGQSARVADSGVTVRDEQGRAVDPGQPRQGVANPNVGPGNNSAGSNPNAGAGNNSGSSSNGGGNPNAGPGNNSGGGYGNGAGGNNGNGNGNGNGSNNGGGGGNSGGGNDNSGSGNNSGGGGGNNGNGGGNGNAGGNGNGNGNGGN